MTNQPTPPGMPPEAPALEDEPIPPPGDARFVVKSPGDIPETVGRNIHARRMFSAAEGRFESSLAFVLFNRLPVGETNVRHIHEDVEKVYYFLRGNAEIDCGPWRASASAGDFLFFPADIAHQIRSLGPEDLEFVVCAASTVGEARGMSDGGLIDQSEGDAEDAS